MKRCKRCKKPIVQASWRDPTRCLDCYLKLKEGCVFVCVAGDVRVADCVPGGFATRRRS